MPVPSRHEAISERRGRLEWSFARVDVTPNSDTDYGTDFGARALHCRGPDWGGDAQAES